MSASSALSSLSVSTVSEYLFPNRDGGAIDHLSRHIGNLGKRYGIDVPTATQSRRATATSVSTAGTEADREAVAEMMSHSVQTHQRYYSMTKGKDRAVKGFQVMESLWHDAPSGSGTSAERVPFFGKGTHRTERDTGGHGRTAGGTDSGTGTPSGKGTRRSERDTADPEKDPKKDSARAKTRPGAEGHRFGTENPEKDTKKGHDQGP